MVCIMSADYRQNVWHPMRKASVQPQHLEFDAKWLTNSCSPDLPPRAFRAGTEDSVKVFPASAKNAARVRKDHRSPREQEHGSSRQDRGSADGRTSSQSATRPASIGWTPERPPLRGAGSDTGARHDRFAQRPLPAARTGRPAQNATDPRRQSPCPRQPRIRS